MALLIIGSQRTEEFASAARALKSGLDIRVWPETGRVEDIRYALAWGPPMGALKTLPNLELIISVGAGVDHLMKDPELPDVPVVRYGEAELTNRVGGYLRLHLPRPTRSMCEF